MDWPDQTHQVDPLAGGLEVAGIVINRRVVRGISR
jgi:hypothetical protein